MSKLTDRQRGFLALVARSGEPGDWCTVSATVMPLAIKAAHEMPALVELDESQGRMRLTHDGQTVLAYT